MSGCRSLRLRWPRSSGAVMARAGAGAIRPTNNESSRGINTTTNSSGVNTRLSGGLL